MNNINIIAIISFVFCLFSFNALKAQQDSLPSDEIQIIKDFDAQLNDFDKVDIFASLPKVDTTRQVTSYSVAPNFLTLTYDAPKIKPLLIAPEQLQTSYDGFVRAAIGYPLMPYVEGGYQYQQDNLVVGGKARYHGAFDWNQLENQKFTDVDADVNAEYQFDQGFALGGNIGYGYDQRFFYGYDNDLFSFESDDVKQYLSLLKAGLEFKNTDQNSLLDYGINADFYTTNDNYVASEYGVGGTAKLAKFINNKHLAQLKIKNQFTKNTSAADYEANLLSILPSFTYHHKKFNVKVGINASLLEKTFKMYPDAKVLANVYKENVSVYLGWKGFAEQISFKHLSELNPYLISTPELRQREVNYPNAGFIFNFPQFNIGIESGYKMVKNNPFFVNDFTNDSKRFAVIYDNVDYITTTLSADAEIINDLNLDFSLNFQNPKQDSLTSNYHDAPNVTIGTKLAYSGLLRQKLTLGTAIYFGSQTPYLSATGSDEKLNSCADLNLFTKYRFNEKFHVFLNLNNLTNQKYQRWNGYRNFGFNAMVGGMWKF